VREAKVSKLLNLAYISRNTIKGDKQAINSEIEDILASAHRNNPAKGITGALLYSGGYFCQVIEGPEEALEELYETIQMDDRHGDVTVLQFEPIEERGFSEWAMAFAGIEDEMRFDANGILASKDELKMREAGKNMVSVLEEMVKQHQSTLNGSA
jgi:hypothetical protein